MRHPLSWFVPREEPVLGLLTAQWATVATTLEAVAGWAAGTSPIDAIRPLVDCATDREREQRQALHARVRAAFWTPLDPEDIYELGERIGMLQRQLDLLVREVGAYPVDPDPGLGGILAAVRTAAATLGQALAVLPADDAAFLADQACDLLDAADDAYRTALHSLADGDIERQIRRRERYHRGEQVTEAAMRIAHRAWYSVCKLG